MPTQIEVQNTILQAQLKFANIVLANTTAERGGNFSVCWDSAVQFYLNINALQRQFDLGDYVSSGAVAIYACLNKLIGYDPSVIVVDPHYQPFDGDIVIINPASYLSPIVITWADMEDSGVDERTTYVNTAWAGVNPFMALTSPGLTGLELGSDYTLIPTGGFILSPSGNLSSIVDGQLITVYSYATA